METYLIKINIKGCEAYLYEENTRKNWITNALAASNACSICQFYNDFDKGFDILKKYYTGPIIKTSKKWKEASRLPIGLYVNPKCDVDRLYDSADVIGFTLTDEYLSITNLRFDEVNVEAKLKPISKELFEALEGNIPINLLAEFNKRICYHSIDNRHVFQYGDKFYEVSWTTHI